MKQIENFQNKMGLMDSKWSSLNAPGTECERAEDIRSNNVTETVWRKEVKGYIQTAAGPKDNQSSKHSSELFKHSLLITQEGRRNCSTGFTQLSFQGLSDICFKESAVRVVLIAQRPVPALDILREVAVLIGFAVKDVKVSLFLP